jgi:hypothetical protein
LLHSRRCDRSIGTTRTGARWSDLGALTACRQLHALNLRDTERPLDAVPFEPGELDNAFARAAVGHLHGSYASVDAAVQSLARSQLTRFVLSQVAGPLEDSRDALMSVSQLTALREFHFDETAETPELEEEKVAARALHRRQPPAPDPAECCGVCLRDEHITEIVRIRSLRHQRPQFVARNQRGGAAIPPRICLPGATPPEVGLWSTEHDAALLDPTNSALTKLVWMPGAGTKRGCSQRDEPREERLCTCREAGLTPL